MAFNLRLIPSRLTGNRYRRLRDIPGSKTVLIALAWGILTTVFPALGEIGPATLPVFLIAAALVFVRTAFFDVLDMQGDRIVGRETIALLLGEKQSLKLLRGILIAVFFGLLLVTALGVVSAFGYPLLACPAFLYLVLAGFERKQMLPGMRLEFLVETHFVLCGCLALLWTIIL
jgi:4-hydroxy-3-methylbut-2-enyl diphosphate reductase